jgi:hypothetical protein
MEAVADSRLLGVPLSRPVLVPGYSLSRQAFRIFMTRAGVPLQGMGALLIRLIEFVVNRPIQPLWGC